MERDVVEPSPPAESDPRPAFQKPSPVRRFLDERLGVVGIEAAEVGGGSVATAKDDRLQRIAESANKDAENGRHPQAIRKWEELISRHGESCPNAHYNMGNSFFAMGKSDKARRCYEIALKHDPLHVDCHYNLGLTLAALGEPEVAKEHFQTIIGELDPNYAGAYHGLACIYHDQGVFDLAIENYGYALDTGGVRDAGCTYFNLARCFHITQNFGPAVECYKRAIDNDTEQLVLAYVNLGCILGNAGRSHEAREYFRQALDLDPENGHALEFMSRLPD